MSVRGVIASLTHRLMRTSSFHAWLVNAASRAASSVVSHSGAYSAQNWLHPAGARAASPIEMNDARSLAAWADAIDSIPAVAKPASAARHTSRTLRFIIVTLPGLEGHVSHKRFEPPLILQSQFEEKPTKQLDECCYHSTRIQTKLESIQFESNAGINPPRPFTRSPAARGSSGVKDFSGMRATGDGAKT
jgi:hypothetical protein